MVCDQLPKLQTVKGGGPNTSLLLAKVWPDACVRLAPFRLPYGAIPERLRLNMHHNLYVWALQRATWCRIQEFHWHISLSSSPEGQHCCCLCDRNCYRKNLLLRQLKGGKFRLVVLSNYLQTKKEKVRLEMPKEWQKCKYFHAEHTLWVVSTKQVDPDNGC